MRMNTKRLLITALALCFAMPAAALAAPLTTFFDPGNSANYVSQADCTWEDTSGDGNYQTCCANCEDYDSELWERPIEDNKWEEISGGADDGKRRLTDGDGGKYYGYADLASGKVGTDGTWVYIQWTSNARFIHIEGKSSPEGSPELMGKYTFYFKAAGEPATAFYVDSAESTLGTGGSYISDSALKVFQSLDGKDPPGTGITQTYDNSNDENDSTGHEATIIQGDDSGDPIRGRIIDLDGGTDYRTVEIAVLLSEIDGYTESDFAVTGDGTLGNLDYFYLGIAESNPSSTTALFANDEFPEMIGSGVEYDTLALAGPAGGGGEPPVPEPATLSLLALGGLALIRRRRTA